MNKLSSKISVNRQFLKSVRIDRDLMSAGALTGYVALESSINVLQRMSRTIAEGRNGAFTWIGPYGSGKSSLALVFSALLSEDKSLKEQAAHLLQLKPDDAVSQVFVGKKSWRSINLVGSECALEDALTRAAQAQGIKVKNGIINSLEQSVSDHNGLVLLIDELGVFLSYAIKHGGMNFLQELAEAAARSKGSLILIGILHQSFDAYIAGYSKEIRDEWAKIQGRFENFVLSPSVFESLALLGSSIVKTDYTAPKYLNTAALAETLFGKTPQFLDSISRAFDNCLPVHPIFCYFAVCSF